MGTTIELTKTGKRIFLPEIRIELKGKTAMLGSIDGLQCTADQAALIEPLFQTKEALTSVYSGYLEQCILQTEADAVQEKELYLIRTESRDPLSGTLITTESAAWLDPSQESVEESVRILTGGAEVTVSVSEELRPTDAAPERRNEAHARDTFLVDASVRGSRIRLQDLKSLETFSSVLYILQKRLAAEQEEEAREISRKTAVPKNLMAVVKEEFR